MGRVVRLARRPVILVPLVLAVVAVGVGLALFQPWKLWVDETVNEAAPVDVPALSQAGEVSPSATGPAPSSGTAPGRPGGGAAPPAGPATVATGGLISHEHATSGTVRVLRLSNGAQVLRLDDLDTSNGPDLHVWLTDQPVRPDSSGWHVFDDGAYLDLGKLKGNKGDQNYPLPAGADLARYTSVTIWCDRFNVSFGAATLNRG